MEKKYSVNKVKSKTYTSAFSIIEWCDTKGKWNKLRKPIGTPKEPITDEALSMFINDNKASELNLGIIGSRGEKHEVDFQVSDLEV